MLQFKNETPFQGAISLMPDVEGIDTLFAVVKATLLLGERLSLAEKQLPVTLSDEYHGEPGKSSIKNPSNVSLTKPATDVLLLGTAYPPRGRPVTQMDVSLKAGPLRKTIRVFGDRVWEKRGVVPSMSNPAPFESMPLIWERAYGGLDHKGKELRAEVRNPVGRGYHSKDGEKDLNGSPLPNLEDPADLLTSWKQSPTPACFAPICGHWEPRLSFAGTYDERWQQERAPYLPTDFDSRFFQLAPPGLITAGYLKPGEWIEAYGVTPSGSLRVQLPPVRIAVTYVVDGAAQLVPADLDTVLIEPDQNRLSLVWRTALRCDKKALRVNEVRAAAQKAA
ncbi:MAG TPA: DUF2169 domain-containing protein [Gemmatimonadales bacterium]|jgi:hypothetical protein|nr:DUF2169 domain-containing protein [Gemmatimonadales bacterium]